MEYVKTLSYAIMHLSVAIMVAYILTQNWKVALSIWILEPVVQTVFYHFHERLWKAKAGSRANDNRAGRVPA